MKLNYRPECMCPSFQKRVTVMIWGCISWHGVGTLCKVTAVKYQEILENNLWPVLARHFSDGMYRFQDDDAPVHRARIIEEYKRDKSINSLTWPAQSPDLNVIENILLRIKRELQNTARNISTPDELFNAINELLTSYQPRYVQNLYNSLPRRKMAVIRSKGFLTKY